MSAIQQLLNSASRAVERLGDRVHQANVEDFGFLAIAAVVTIWYLTRYFGD